MRKGRLGLVGRAMPIWCPQDMSRPDQSLSEFVNSPRSHVSVASAARDLWAYREVVVAFGARNFRIRYKEAVLGAGWAVLQPLVLFVPFVIFFGRVAKVGGGGAPYPAFAASVLIGWQFCATAISTASNSLISEAGLMRKVYFPRAAPVLGAVGASYVDLAIGLSIGIPAVVLLGGELGIPVISIPLLIIGLTLPVLGLSLLLAGLNVYYRDVRYALPAVIQVLLFASPISFPLSRVPIEWRTLYAALNPLVGPLDGFRRVLALGQWPSLHLLGISGLSGLLLTLVAAALFVRLESEIADLS